MISVTMRVCKRMITYQYPSVNFTYDRSNQNEMTDAFSSLLYVLPQLEKEINQKHVNHSIAAIFNFYRTMRYQIP